MFHVGQLVVCIKGPDEKAIRHWSALNPVWPAKGQVLTIRSIFEWCGLTLLRFQELYNTSPALVERALGEEPGYNCEHFRPLDDNRIAIFRQLLVTPPKQKVDA
jgi:hypothetical protein